MGHRKALVRQGVEKLLAMAAYGHSKHLDKQENKGFPAREKIYSSRQVIDAKVEEAILKKALGFETTEIRQVTKANGDEEITAVTKLVPPDISACSMWLSNSCPEKWGDKKDNGGSKVEEILSRLDQEGEECDC